MSLLKFKVTWSEDDNTCRDIEILSSHTYYDLHLIIKKELMMPADMEASIYVSNDQWKKEREISSTIEKNLRDALALSMKKTPIGALIVDPHQKYVYVCVHPKEWIFYLELVTLLPEPAQTEQFPRCTKSEGISPSQLGLVPTIKDSVVEIEERYDLAGDEEGFGDEGEEENNNNDEEDISTQDLAGEDF